MINPGIARSIESIIGADHITESPTLVIDGHSPNLLARPGSHEEVKECLRACSGADLAVVPAGLMSWLESGNPLRRADIVLSLERMNRIIDYSPADLTVVVEAGLTVKEMYRATEMERQWLPLDPPGAAQSSLGAVAACASSGSLRLGFGTPRDYVIGLRLAHAGGSESKSGGRVVKNVAGYDMNKLYVGSFGTLAVITELTFKLRPLPDSSSSLLVSSHDPESLAGIARRVLAMDLLPASVMLAGGVLESESGSRPGEWSLAIRFIENETTVRSQIDRVKEMLGSNNRFLTLSASEERALWDRMIEIEKPGTVVCKISLPLSETLNALDRVSSSVPICAATCDAGTGIIRIAFEADEMRAVEAIKRLRAEAMAIGGTLIIERAALAIRQQADAWGDIGPTASIMKAIKEKLDPQSILNPGRFVCGI
jgi:glycolate oxidase FAD binding subunit